MILGPTEGAVFFRILAWPVAFVIGRWIDRVRSRRRGLVATVHSGQRAAI